MEILGYIAAMLIGLSLGLIGGGGSILTVPVLVYLIGLNPVISTAYSLFIVGLTSLVGSWKFYKKGLVSLKTAVVFGLPSIVAVYITRRYIVPAIPENLFTVGDLVVTKGVLLMLLFAGLMVFASISMIKKKKEVPAEPVDVVDENIDTELDVEHSSDVSEYFHFFCFINYLIQKYGRLQATTVTLVTERLYSYRVRKLEKYKLGILRCCKFSGAKLVAVLDASLKLAFCKTQKYTLAAIDKV